MATPIQVEIWSDVVCPWCYIGKRRFEAALADFTHRDDVQVIYRSFQLDPSAPRPGDGRPRPRTVEYLAGKYGQGEPSERIAQAEQMMAQVDAIAAADGLAYDQSAAVLTNTIDAHRLLHAALAHGGPTMQSALKEGLLAAYFSHRQDLGDVETLVRLAVEAGLPENLARDVLAGDRHADAVRADQDMARALGVSGVPFFVVDRRYGISGAQPVEVFSDVLNRVLAEAGTG